MRRRPHFVNFPLKVHKTRKQLARRGTFKVRSLQSALKALKTSTQDFRGKTNVWRTLM